MVTLRNRQNVHDQIDTIFQTLLPLRGMEQRTGQIKLSHDMLDAMLDNRIALCDAGTGIGKTYAYLVAGILFLLWQSANGMGFLPIIISTSSIALQNAVQNEYLPLLSDVLMEAGIVDKPVQAVIRKGKQHYVCDDRLERRLKQVAFSKKNASALAALRSLRRQVDLDAVQHLSGYDRDRVCVPQTCRCQRQHCRYRTFLEECDSQRYAFQICNHNLLLADAKRREAGHRPILTDGGVFIIDEAHKLPETARQMLGVTLTAEDIMEVCRTLDAEGYLIAAERVKAASAPLVRKLLSPEPRGFSAYECALTAPERTLDVADKQLRHLVSPATRRALDEVHKALKLIGGEPSGMVAYATMNERNETVLCAAVADLGKPLKAMLWDRRTPILLTSGTLAIGSDFRQYRGETGLLNDFRVTESVSLSPFNYRENCLLYFTPRRKQPQKRHSSRYYDILAREIRALLLATHGHALVLFTAYSAMTAVKSRLSGLPIPIYAMDRNAAYALKRFRMHPGSILFATGAAWEGMDFAGDCVSLLVIPSLPFPQPNALSERKRGEYPDLHSFIRNIIVPEMQIKLKQGFGRAIRTETDTCVVAILDERAAAGGRYHEDVLAALPEMRATTSVEDIKTFIQTVKSESYFMEGNQNGAKCQC